MILSEMNDNHMDDIKRFCNIFVDIRHQVCFSYFKGFFIIIEARENDVPCTAYNRDRLQFSR